MTARWFNIGMPGIPPARTPEEVDRRIEVWHTNESLTMELHEYLGWTEEEYATWLQTSVIPNFRDRS